MNINKIKVNGTEYDVEDASARASATALDTRLTTAEGNITSKANTADVYTKTATDTLLNAKANSSDVYTKSAVDTALNGKADSTAIPTTIAQLTDDSTHRVVTDTEKSTWNGKSDFSGDYNDLENKPTIPVVPTNVSAFTNDSGYLTLATLPVYTGVVV